MSVFLTWAEMAGARVDNFSMFVFVCVCVCVCVCACECVRFVTFCNHRFHAFVILKNNKKKKKKTD
jgi:hypothetical protein